MNRIHRLRNQVMPYAWGSRCALQRLLGRSDQAGKPMAELWMGAHPKAPSLVERDGRWMPLDRVVEQDPAAVLGKGVFERFGPRLPFLFKVLAAEHPLSIQVHPGVRQARAGFARENRAGIPLDAPRRNYKDPNHKPEMICALGPFDALLGFRPVEEMLPLLRQVAGESLAPEIRLLSEGSEEGALKRFFETLMRRDPAWRRRAVAEARQAVAGLRHRDPAFMWVLKLIEAYPEDMGVLAPLFMNLVHLETTEALFIGAGELHAYLQGMGIELMANSDNVLRAGLTPKHVDLDELLRVGRFKPLVPRVLRGQGAGLPEARYPCPAEEFELSRITLAPGQAYAATEIRSVEIILCIEGQAAIRCQGNRQAASLAQGDSVLVPAAVGAYQATGQATLYKASVPV